MQQLFVHMPKQHNYKQQLTLYLYTNRSAALHHVYHSYTKLQHK